MRSSKGRTELQINVSRAKICEEVAGDVRFCVALQKTGKNIEKLHEIFEKQKKTRFSKKIYGIFLPKASECVQMYPNA